MLFESVRGLFTMWHFLWMNHDWVVLQSWCMIRNGLWITWPLISCVWEPAFNPGSVPIKRDQPKISPKSLKKKSQLMFCLDFLMKSTQIIVINWEVILWHKGFIWNSLLLSRKEKKIEISLSCFGLKFSIFIVVSSFSLYPSSLLKSIH